MTKEKSSVEMKWCEVKKSGVWMRWCGEVDR